MKVTTFVVQLEEGVKLEHLYEKFLAHDTLLHYHRALAKNDVVAYGPFEQATPREVEEESGEGSAAGGCSDVHDPVLPFFKRKASVLMPLAAPRPLQLALGTSVIKLRLRQSVAVLRRAKVVDGGGGGGNSSSSSSSSPEPKSTSESKPPLDPSSLAPLDAIEFRSAPRLWIPEAKDLPLGKISLVATYEEIGDDGEGGAAEGTSSSPPSDASADADATATSPAPTITPFHLSPRRPPSSSSSSSSSPAVDQPSRPRRQRVRIDVTATADFRPENGILAAFKRPLESVMLTMVTKSARSMAGWFAACAASDAGVGPLHPDFGTFPEMVPPRLPRELAYLETRRLSVDGPPGVSRGLTVDEAEEMHVVAARGSERAARVAARAAELAAAVVAAEAAAEAEAAAAAGGAGRLATSATEAATTSATSTAMRTVAAPAAPAPPLPPSSFAEPVTPDREVSLGNGNLSRVSLASSVESFHSAASEIFSSERMGEGAEGEEEEEGEGDAAADAADVKKTAVAKKRPPSSSAAPATPARGRSADGKVTVSLGPPSSQNGKRVLRMPRWLVPGGSGGGGSQAKAAAAATTGAARDAAASVADGDASTGSTRPRSAPGGSFKGGEGEEQQQQQQAARRPKLAWLRPKSART